MQSKQEHTEEMIDAFANKAASADEEKVLHDVSSKVEKLEASNNSTIKELLYPYHAELMWDE